MKVQRCQQHTYLLTKYLSWVEVKPNEGSFGAHLTITRPPVTTGPVHLHTMTGWK